MSARNTTIENQKIEGRSLLLQMDVLKRFFGITARKIYKKAGISNEAFANDVLHGRRKSKPALKKIQSAVFYFSHSKKFKSFFLKGQLNSFPEILRKFE